MNVDLSGIWHMQTVKGGGFLEIFFFHKKSNAGIKCKTA